MDDNPPQPGVQVGRVEERMRLVVAHGAALGERHADSLIDAVPELREPGTAPGTFRTIHCHLRASHVDESRTAVIEMAQAACTRCALGALGALGGLQSIMRNKAVVRVTRRVPSHAHR